MAVLLSDTIILNIGIAVISMALHEMYEAVGRGEIPAAKNTRACRVLCVYFCIFV